MLYGAHPGAGHTTQHIGIPGHHITGIIITASITIGITIILAITAAGIITGTHRGELIITMRGLGRTPYLCKQGLSAAITIKRIQGQTLQKMEPPCLKKIFQKHLQLRISYLLLTRLEGLFTSQAYNLL